MASAIPRAAKFFREHLPEIAAAGGGAAAAASGVGLPLAAALAGLLGAGGRGGQIAMDATEGKVSPSIGQDIADMGIEGVTQGAMAYGGGRVFDAAGRVGQAMGKRALKGAMKMDRGFLSKMAGAKQAGINAMEDQIVDTAIRHNVNPITRGGEGKIQSAIDRVAGARTGEIARAPNVPISGQADAMVNAARRKLSRVGRGPAPQDDIATVRNFIKDLETSPQMSKLRQTGVKSQTVTSPIVDAGGKPITHTVTSPIVERKLVDQTPVELSEAVEQGNKRLSGLFSGGAKDSEIQARLAVQKAMTRSLDRAAGTRGLSRELKNLINLRESSQIARRRSSATNPVSITDVISLSSGHPGIALASAGMKAPALAAGGLLLNRTGRAVANPTQVADVLRRLLLAETGSAAVQPDEE